MKMSIKEDSRVDEAYLALIIIGKLLLEYIKCLCLFTYNTGYFGYFIFRFVYNDSLQLCNLLPVSPVISQCGHLK